MATKLLLKELLFNEHKVRQLAQEIKAIYPVFDTSGFINATTNKFPELELKQRISWMRECLKIYLPEDYEEAVRIILRALPKPNDPDLSDNDFGDFIYSPFADYIAAYGCRAETLQVSLHALKEITQRFSVEDAIRYFINAFPTETMSALLHWSRDTHYHVRRLASEGTRPKLPWAQKINLHTEETIPILDNLYTDKTRFVTRSVANHLNDISKTDPKLVFHILTKWQNSVKQSPKEMEFIIRHSLRTLVKRGDPRVFSFLHLSNKPKVTVSNFEVESSTVRLGSALNFSFLLKALHNESLFIDYIISFQNKRGEMNNKKVYKLKRVIMKRNETIHIQKSHPMIEHMTTRTIYPGKHKIAVQINGNILIIRNFEIVK